MNEFLTGEVLGKASFITLVLLLVLTYNVNSQPLPTHEFKMDDCTLDDSRSMSDGFVFGPSPCGCGVRSNALQMDGNVHFGEFSDAVSDFLSGDFSMSFYVNFENSGTSSVDLFSLASSCRRDSAFFIRYFPSVGRISALISDQPGNEVELRGDLEVDACWNYIALTKRGSVARLYINNVLADEGAAVSPITLDIDDNLSLANGPCLILQGNPDVRFMGRIDELRFYNRELSEVEVAAADFMPDRIISRDTTIFSGESVVLRTGGTCADDFQWSPTSGLSDPGLLEPTASPERSTTYTLNINGEGCSAIDQVRVNVVSNDELLCDDLKLPSAFTPNNDGINDFYGISNDFLIERLTSFEIFNKWGGRVFFTEEINGLWDGQYKGEDAPPNSYVYRVVYTCQGVEHQVTGTVNVLR